MPTYDYECKDCGYEFEYFQSMSEDPLSTCPQCGGDLRRLIGGGTGVIFKASGFYVTDNKKTESSKKGAKESQEAASDGNGSGNGDGNGEKKEKKESTAAQSGGESSKQSSESNTSSGSD